MALTTELNLDDAIGHIANGIGATLETKIKAALMSHAEKVVEEVAKQLCENLKAAMTGYYDPIDGAPRIVLVINGVRREI